MRIVFCDDDPIILAQLQKYVAEFFYKLNIKPPEFAAYTSGDELLKCEKRADIAFLDVEMPGASGIYIGSKLKDINPRIKIFIVTSYPDYLDEAMRFQVFRYLSKPIDKTRLHRNLKDAVYQYEIDTREFAVSTKQGIVTVKAEEIVCVEFRERKVYVHTVFGVVISTDSMEHWRSVLTMPCFFSTYRSFIVNMRYVRSVSKDTVQLSYSGNTITAYLARRKYTEFKDSYLLYLESSR